jgi:uncharacterized membrane protein (UPF0127 family)
MSCYKKPQSVIFNMVILLFLLSIVYYLPVVIMGGEQKVYALNADNISSSSVRIKDLIIYVDLAKTPEQQAKGLSIKNTLNENEGMLFIFDTPKEYSFWMKDMKFPIDIIWIGSDNKIVHIEKNLQPCTFFLICTSYSPHANSKYVLEVPSNYTTKNNITIGDRVNFFIDNSTQNTT